MSSVRRGLTLLEVLISVFIMAIGLMSLAALIPLGQTQVQDGVRADVGSSVGRAAFRDLQVRGFLDASMWQDHADNATPLAWDVDRVDTLSIGGYDATFQYARPAGVPAVAQVIEQFIPGAAGSAAGHPLDWGNSVCIDPLFVSRAAMLNGGALAPTWPGRKFPYELTNDPDPQATDSDPDTRDGFSAYPNPPRMQRLNVSLVDIGLANFLDARFAAVNRIFTWQDDVIFNQPDDAGLRALGQPLYAGAIDSTGKFVPFKASPTDPPLAVRQDSNGDYSWLFTVTPEATDVPGTQSAMRTFTVSVVVFHRRALNQMMIAPDWTPADSGYKYTSRIGLAPNERTLYADFHSQLGFGGGEVRLRLPAHANYNDKANQPENSDFPNVRPGQWIMLCAWTPGDTAEVGGTPPVQTITDNPDYTLAQDSRWTGQSAARLPVPYLPTVRPVTTTVFNEERTRAVFRWYKVVAVADGPAYKSDYEPNGSSGPQVPTWFRDVTLVGPDWPLYQQDTGPNASGNPVTRWHMSFIDADDPNPTDNQPLFGAFTVWAAVIDGVVGVYEKTITLDPQS